MRTRLPPHPHPLRSIFEARRSYDEARQVLYRMLAGWAAGELTYADVEPSLSGLADAQTHLFAAVNAHRGTTVSDVQFPRQSPDQDMGALRNFLPKRQTV